jgi:hypothetical protein
MANVFRQFLLDAENGDIDAVRRNIEHGIGLETRDEVRQKQFQLCYYLFYSGSTNSPYFICSM